MVGTAGFEPATPCSQGRCATRLRHVPLHGEFTARKPAIWDEHLGRHSHERRRPRAGKHPPAPGSKPPRPPQSAALLASATAMAEVQPLRALHYDPAVVGPLADVVAPPYDVIDAQQRAALIARSPFNVVAIDLPEGNPDPYAAAREQFESWQLQGALVRDEQPAIWAHTQDYTGPDGRTLTRRGFFCRVRIEDYGPGRVRPHDRTHPGPKEDRLRLTRATRANTSPIFSLYSDPTEAAWRALAPATERPPWGEVSDADGTVHRIWRVSDPAAIEAVQRAAGGAELLIADGHHRYETMQAYAEEI